MLAFSNDYYGMIFRATQSVELFCAYDFTVSFLKKMRIKKLVYGTMKPSKIGGGFMNQYNIIVQQLLAYLTKRKQYNGIVI